jgi:hypothetical protein
VNDEMIKYYELLGVAPGVSAQELKTAHRDLAKVWHPDRFAHDPRLQQKAQEKLKEINEAYDLLVSLKTGRRAPQPQPPASQTARTAAANHGRTPWKSVLLPAIIFVLISFAAFRALFPTDARLTPNPSHQNDLIKTPAVEEQDQSGSVSNPPLPESQRGKRAGQQFEKEAKTGEASTSEQDAGRRRPLPTVTVTIDPVTGMIATPACPVKSSMTYPSGREPGQYCNASHTSAGPEQTESPRPKESRLKSFAKRLAAPASLFRGKGTPESNDGREAKTTATSARPK